jgi:hypothetical protein
MVYGKGMGARESKAPAVLSKDAPWRLLKDGARGLRWLATSALLSAKRRRLTA